jgi:hypothetical protein
MNLYHGFEFVIDDSGSMMSPTDTMDARVRPITRWQEENDRLKRMIEVLAYVPTPPMEFKFLNRTGFLLKARPRLNLLQKPTHSLPRFHKAANQS